MRDVWELWRRAKTLEWDPQTDIPWEELHPERYSAEQLLAAQMYWSRRTWGEYGAISESPALLLRFCLERQVPDLQFFFTMRTMEEGRHADASWLMAERLGRYFRQPQNPPTAGAVGAMIETVGFRGYRNLWLAIEGGSATPAEIDLDRISCEAGLGGNSPEDEMRVFPDFLKKIRKRMAPWGVSIPMFDHPRLGKV